MTKQEYEKLLDALWTVKEYCEKHKACRDCLISEEGSNICTLKVDRADYWDLPERKNHDNM